MFDTTNVRMSQNANAFSNSSSNATVNNFQPISIKKEKDTFLLKFNLNSRNAELLFCDTPSIENEEYTRWLKEKSEYSNYQNRYCFNYNTYEEILSREPLEKTFQVEIVNLTLLTENLCIAELRYK